MIYVKKLCFFSSHRNSIVQKNVCAWRGRIIRVLPMAASISSDNYHKIVTCAGEKPSEKEFNMFSNTHKEALVNRRIAELSRH